RHRRHAHSRTGKTPTRRNATMNTQSPRHVLVAACLVAALASTTFADLPGLPKPVAPPDETRTSVQATTVQTGPVRGSLFKQGATAAAQSGLSAAGASA